MVVRDLRPPHLVGEAGQRHPVGAGVAVHPDVAAQRLVVALEHQPGEFGAVADEPGYPDVEVAVPGGELARLRRHPVRQHPGEQEVRGDDDAAGAQPAGPVQGRGHRRLGQRDERVLHARVAPALPQQPGHFGDLGVRVGVGGPAAGQDHPGVLPGRPGECGVDPCLEKVLQHRMRAERAPVARGQAGMAAEFPGQSGWDVALAVAGRGEDQRDRDHRAAGRRGRGQPGDRIGHGWPGQFDEPAGHGGDAVPGAGADPLDEPGELGNPRGAAGPVPDDQQGRTEPSRACHDWPAARPGLAPAHTRPTGSWVIRRVSSR